MISYFIYTIISLGCSYALYFLLLRKQKTFQFNRFFLLGSLILCFAAPFLEIEFLNSAPRITEIPFQTLSETTSVSQNIEDVDFNNVVIQSQSQFSLWWLVYGTITLFFALRFLKNIFQLYKLTKGEHENFGKLKIIRSKDSEMASSFFNYMFINENQTLVQADFLSIMKHETVHYEEKHTLDIIFIELIVCVFWINPFVWFYRKSILQNHEYIADDKSVSSGIDIENYSNTIINLGHKEHRVPLTSGFNFIQIKNRIIMLHQSKSSVLTRTLKITAVILLFAGIFIFSSCKEDLEESLIEDSLIVVIDAGHGGEDSGQLSGDSREKDVVLNISNQLALLSSNKVEVILTRNDDTFSSLEDRVGFINAQNADLVISLHCNAHSVKETSGVEAYYYDKNEFKDQSYKYSKILLENQIELFSTSRGIKTANMYILKHINSPGVILELGFLTNEKDRSILMNTENQKEIAKSIMNGLMEVRKMK